MPSLTLDDRLIWFAHCPKAGGTSLERAMVDTWGDQVGHLRWGWDIWWRRGGWRVADPPNSPQHLTWMDAKAVLPRRPDAVFALVRDPAARMVSEYYWQRQARRAPWAGRLLAYLPFGVWLRLMLAMAQQNAFVFDNHFRPQTDFVPKDAVIFRLEDGLSAALGWLTMETGTDLGSVCPHELKSKNGALRLSRSVLARIAIAFADDYDRFGYTCPAAFQSPRDMSDKFIAAIASILILFERRGML